MSTTQVVGLVLLAVFGFGWGYRAHQREQTRQEHGWKRGERRWWE